MRTFPKLSRTNRFAVTCVVILVAAVAARIVWLANIPGMNGDEAYYSTALLRFREGGSLPLVAPSGRPLSLTYYLSAYILSGGLTFVNFWTIRLPALFWGISLLILTFVIAKKRFDSDAALLATIIMACLPLNIIYARIGWDPSQIVVASALILYLAWNGKWRWLAVLFPAAVFNIHPTIVMMAPVVALTLSGAVLEDDTVPARRKAAAIAGIAVVIGAMVVIYMTTMSSPYRAVDREGNLSLARLPEFYDLFLSYISGVTVFREFGASVPQAAAVAHKAVAGLAFVGAFLCAAVGSWRRRNWRDVGVVCGTFIMIHSVFLVPKFLPYAQDYSRYGLAILAPLCFIPSLALSHLGAGYWRRAVLFTGTALCSAMLLSYTVYFLESYRTSAGASLEANATWQGGARDPKLQLYEWIQGERRRQGLREKTVVLATDEWLFNVLELFSVRDGEITAMSLRNPGTAKRLQACEAESATQSVFVVDFADHLLDDYLAKSPHANISLTRGFYGYNGVLVLKVWEMRRPFRL